MATIRKTPSGTYQAQIRLKHLKQITRTFRTKKEAVAFTREVEGNSKLARKLGDPAAFNVTLSDIITDYLWR